MTDEQLDAIEAAATLIAKESGFARWELADLLARAQGGSPFDPDFEAVLGAIAGANANAEREADTAARAERLAGWSEVVF